MRGSPRLQRIGGWNEFVREASLNSLLSWRRNLLLPKLVSGEVEVRESELLVP